MDTSISVSTSDRTRAERINIRCFAWEKRRCSELAKASYMSLSDYAIWSMLNEDKPVFIINKNDIEDIQTELARQGNNLNQIAHAFNILAKKSNRLEIEELLEDGLGQILRINIEIIEAYRATTKLQSKVYKSTLARTANSTL